MQSSSPTERVDIRNSLWRKRKGRGKFKLWQWQLTGKSEGNWYGFLMRTHEQLIFAYGVSIYWSYKAVTSTSFNIPRSALYKACIKSTSYHNFFYIINNWNSHYRRNGRVRRICIQNYNTVYYKAKQLQPFLYYKEIIYCPAVHQHEVIFSRKTFEIVVKIAYQLLSSIIGVHSYPYFWPRNGAYGPPQRREQGKEVEGEEERIIRLRSLSSAWYLCWLLKMAT